MTVLTVEDARNYRLEANVDESEIRSVRIGQTVPVSLDELPVKNLSGKVSQIVPTADPASRSFLVKIDLPPVAKLRSGLFGRARFTRGERSAILAPLTAIVNRGQLQGVYVLDANAIAGLRYVTLGPGANEQVEVLSGLEAGDKLIDAPGDREYAGKKIAGLP
jgi:multidrug efflux pump subunit AcrA (membrane-fusion protein)